MRLFDFFLRFDVLKVLLHKTLTFELTEENIAADEY